jgi:outer membrane PBP1 activator LpoA protein
VKKLSIVLAALALTGCATIQEHASTVGQRMCDNREAFQLSYMMMMQNAVFISDPVLRQQMMGTAQAGLEALAQCPGESLGEQ